MRIFVFEFLSGGGLFDTHWTCPADETLRGEGLAMLHAVAADFSALPETQITTLWDARLPLPTDPLPALVHAVGDAPSFAAAFAQMAHAADYTLLIAPELCRALERWAERACAAGATLLGPGPELLTLASDKHATAEFLAAHDIAVPDGVQLNPHEPLPADFRYPAVYKPLWGAGSVGVQLVTGLAAGRDLERGEEPARLERFCPGLPASVAILCGPEGCFPLPACRQHLVDDGTFRYLGGTCPLEPALAQRAQQLALAAARTLPHARGYVGIDLVLGEDPHGTDDVVIEINPRLTTSYIGLRALSKTNLAAAMCAAARGQTPRLEFGPQTVEFDVHGGVRRLD